MTAIVITHGDPAGIGPYVMAQALQETWDIHSNVTRILTGNTAIWKAHLPATILGASRVQLPGEAGSLPTPGQASKASALSAKHSLQQAADLLTDGTAAGVCTGPISKEWMQQVGFQYPGHTEWLAEIARTMTGRTDPYAMVFLGHKLNVVLATIHLPLLAAIQSLDSARIEKTVRLAVRDGKRYGLPASPRIWVCGINPHAGENGLLGTQESDWLEPLVAKLQAEGIAVEGPFPPDTTFAMATRPADQHKQPDLVVAMYHDQGLIPFKLLHFEDGVNATLGLPFVRTSPDHGTAFGLARNPEEVSAASATAALRILLNAVS